VRISTKGQYSLEALLYLAMLPGKDFISTRSIADATGISEGYLEQLFIPLRKAGIIRGSRGKRGGYVPGREPERITVGDILRTAEGILEPVNCIKSINVQSRQNVQAGRFGPIFTGKSIVALIPLPWQTW